MSIDDKKIKFNDADVASSAENNACVSDSQAVSQEEPEQSRPAQNRKSPLILLIMLAVSIVIVLFASNGFIDHTPDTVTIKQQAELKSELPEVKAELQKVIDNLNEINRNPNLKDDHIDVIPVVVKPVTPVPAVLAPVAVAKKKTVTKPEKKIVSKPTLEIVAPVAAATPPVEQTVAPPVVAVEQPAYIKHDVKGGILADNEEYWECVYDTATGLMWEVKSEDDAMRKSDNLYSWYDPEGKTIPGKADGGRCAGEADCDTYAYVQVMNERNFCGYNDWQLPTKEEMQTLVNHENSDTATIDKQYFPQAVPSWYWTSSENEQHEDLAWYVLFRNGFALNDLKERPKHIRLVRKQVGDSNGG